MDTTYYDHGTHAERWERAGMFFDAKDYTAAARVLGSLVEEVPEQTAPRLLLARAYYHSAQLRRAEAELRIIVDRDPVEHYAQLMLGRTLQRQGAGRRGAAASAARGGAGRGVRRVLNPSDATVPGSPRGAGHRACRRQRDAGPYVRRPRRWAISPSTMSAARKAASGMPSRGTK